MVQLHIRADPLSKHGPLFRRQTSYENPQGGSYRDLGSFSRHEDQRLEFKNRTDSQANEFDARTGEVSQPLSQTVEDRYAKTLQQQSDIRNFVAAISDDLAIQTAQTNGEAHVQKYGVQSFVERSGGEDNARIILGDNRYEELVLQEAEKQSEDRKIRSAK